MKGITDPAHGASGAAPSLEAAATAEGATPVWLFPKP
jgi:hypothetical protein